MMSPAIGAAQRVPAKKWGVLYFLIWKTVSFLGKGFEIRLI
jgi:hypothetical protein